MPSPQFAAPAGAPAAPMAPQAPTAPLTPSAPLAPAAPHDPHRPGTEASRALLGPAPSARPLVLWGSSSMSSEGGAEDTPVAIRIHEHLALAAAPAPVHAFGVSATRSEHTLLMRGLTTPQIRVLSTADARSGAVEVQLDPALAPAGLLRIPGQVGEVSGVLDGSSGSWSFIPEDPAQQVTDGIFRSALAATAEGARQVLWMGKNNIVQVDAVLEHTQRMWDATADPAQDTLVLGQWPTPFDPRGSETAEALEAVNAEQAERYGEHFVDIAGLLTSEAGLTCPPLRHLPLLEQGSTQDDLAQNVVPQGLRATDDIHLNGWGNLAVSWAIVQRMRELRWL